MPTKSQYKRNPDDPIVIPTTVKTEDLAATVRQQSSTIQMLEKRLALLERKLMRAQSDISDVDSRLRRRI